MPRSSGKVPAYSRHKHSGQAVVRLDGHEHYLGPYGSPLNHEQYARLIAQWRATGREAKPPSATMAIAHLSTGALSVEQVLGHDWRWAKSYYARRRPRRRMDRSRRY